MQTERHYNEEQTDGRTVHRIHFLSQVDDNRCESIDVLANGLDVVDPKTINADGVLIQFQGNIAEITVVEPELP